MVSDLSVHTPHSDHPPAIPISSVSNLQKFKSKSKSSESNGKSMNGFFNVLLHGGRRVYNLEWLFWGIVSTIALHFVTDRQHHLHGIVSLTWFLGYNFCALVCTVILAHRELKIMSEVKKLSSMELEHTLLHEEDEEI